MAGRPRTMLKLLATWEERAEQLFEDIRQRIPARYVDYDTDFEKYADRDGLVLLDDIPKYDPVACEWKSSLEAAQELFEHLWSLQMVIQRRLDSKGARVGKTSPPTKSKT